MIASQSTDASREAGGSLLDALVLPFDFPFVIPHTPDRPSVWCFMNLIKLYIAAYAQPYVRGVVSGGVLPFSWAWGQGCGTPPVLTKKKFST